MHELRSIRRPAGRWVRAGLAAAFVAGGVGPAGSTGSSRRNDVGRRTTTAAAGDEPMSCTNALDTAAKIQDAMRNAAPGAVLLIAPGTYTGSTSTSGDSGRFYSGRSGTAAQPIVLQSCDPTHPAVLSGGSVSDGSYCIHLTGDYWEIRDLVVTQAEKGIVIDNGNHNLLSGLEVVRIGDEGVHFRDGSSYNTLEHSKIHDTGRYQAGFGEGAYVGSDYAASYQHVVRDNVIRTTDFAGGITAEHIDIKEGADGTVVEYCTFDGRGISGANSADSFVDVKGVNTTIRYNQGFRNGESHLLDAFQVRTHGSGYATGKNNRFNNNTIDLDQSAGYVVYATSSATGTSAHDDVRIGGGHLYSSNVTSTVAVHPLSWGAVKSLYRR
jgi:parallel beta helix pectate lyase-like protein